MKIIDNAGYKDLSGIRRIPIARVVGKGGVVSIVIGNEAIDQAGARIKGKPYMVDAMMDKLFDGSPLVVEEKVDGHPTIIVKDGYTFFCEQLSVQHSVAYEQVPYSLEGWPDMTVVYDVLDGEFEPPYRTGTGARMPWLSRSEKESVCEMVGAPVVPLVWQGKVSPEGLPKLADRISSFSGASKVEGIVLKNYRTGVFGKFINLEFQQRITDEALQGGIHPMQRGVKNTRRYANLVTRVADRFLCAAPAGKPPRPKTRVGVTYGAYVGDRFIGTIGRMSEDEVLMDIDGRPYKIISLAAFNDWVAKMPPAFRWERQG